MKIYLRDNLLQLADNTDVAPGWYDMDEAARFRLMLVSKQSAVYSSDGSYLGQELPFAVAPFSSFQLGEEQGVSLLTGGGCAERIW